MDESQKPDIRERIQSRGPENLSDSELVALLLRTGTKDMPVLSLAGRVINALENGKNESIYQTLYGIDGIGDTKAGTILAAIELGRRYSGMAHQKVKKASDVYPLVRHYADRKQEQFICVSLNGAHEVIAIRVVSVGILNKTMASPS
jgi:DNA repair protein RadC